MKLTEMTNFNSTKLNNKMKQMVGWNIDLNALNLKSAKSMMESVDNKLSAVRKSSKIHESERNPNYTSMLLARQVLESYILENSNSLMESKKKAKPDFLDVDKDGNKKESMKKALKDKEKSKSVKEEVKVKEGNKFSGELEKAKKAGKTEFEVDGKKYKVNEAELRVNEKAKSVKHQQAAGATLAAKRGDAPKTGLKGASKEMSKMSTKELEKLAGTKHKGLPKKVSESRLYEDELSQAQAMLAARDMVDSMQDMIEDISKMLNEQLPPLTDSIRAAIGSAEADTFKGAATSTLQTLLSTVQTSRESMDQAVRALTGEAADIAMPGDMGSDMNAVGDMGDMSVPPEGDEFGASDAAAGGELPMGREKRA